MMFNEYDDDSAATPSDLKDVPKDAVVLLVWRDFAGSTPVTILVTEESWLMNYEMLVVRDMKFDPDFVYEFESPLDSMDRKTLFHLQGITGWAANMYRGKDDA